MFREFVLRLVRGSLSSDHHKSSICSVLPSPKRMYALPVLCVGCAAVSRQYLRSQCAISFIPSIEVRHTKAGAFAFFSWIDPGA